MPDFADSTTTELERKIPPLRVVALTETVTYCVLAFFWLSGNRPGRLLMGSAHGMVAMAFAAMVIGVVVALPLTLPVLPVTDLARGSWQGDINKDLSATVGWPRVVRQVANIAATLPPAERAHVVVFTGDYGAAGAVDLYGRDYGLRHAVSGHNTYWWWGPPPPSDDGATVIAVNIPASDLRTVFADVKPAGTVDTGFGIWTEERGAPIFICRGQRSTWVAAWPAAKHYG